MKNILLTFDVEEFDLLRNSPNCLNKEEEFEISRQGLSSVSDLLFKHNLKATFFTTALFAKKYPNLIKELNKEYEIACHGYCHSEECSLQNIAQAKKEIEKIIKNKIYGFRAPRFQIKNIHKLNELGFLYDSSLHPTFIPGRYFNLLKSNKIHKLGKIIEIPPSVLPITRLPIFWLVFKNTPRIYHRLFTRINFLSSHYTMLLFHPWEFADLSKINLPKYIKRKHSKKLLNLLDNYIQYSKKKYSFKTISEFLRL